jgi:hypothetical protein
MSLINDINNHPMPHWLGDGYCDDGKKHKDGKGDHCCSVVTQTIAITTDTSTNHACTAGGSGKVGCASDRQGWVRAPPSDTKSVQFPRDTADPKVLTRSGGDDPRRSRRRVSDLIARAFDSSFSAARLEQSSIANAVNEAACTVAVPKQKNEPTDSRSSINSISYQVSSPAMRSWTDIIGTVTGPVVPVARGRIGISAGSMLFLSLSFNVAISAGENVTGSRFELTRASRLSTRDFQAAVSTAAGAIQLSPTKNSCDPREPPEAAQDAAPRSYAKMPLARHQCATQCVAATTSTEVGAASNVRAQFMQGKNTDMDVYWAWLAPPAFICGNRIHTSVYHVIRARVLPCDGDITSCTRHVTTHHQFLAPQSSGSSSRMSVSRQWLIRTASGTGLAETAPSRVALAEYGLVDAFKPWDVWTVSLRVACGAAVMLGTSAISSNVSPSYVADHRTSHHSSVTLVLLTLPALAFTTVSAQECSAKTAAQWAALGVTVQTPRWWRREWDEDAPEKIADRSAHMPDDWDEDENGDWEAPTISNPKCDNGCGKWPIPMIPNPDYKGKWYAQQIDNPAYKGEWKAKQIDNPGFYEDLEPYKVRPFSRCVLATTAAARLSGCSSRLLAYPALPFEPPGLRQLWLLATAAAAAATFPCASCPLPPRPRALTLCCCCGCVARSASGPWPTASFSTTS